MGKYLELFTGSFPIDGTLEAKTSLENKPYVAYSIKDKNVVYTIIPNESSTMYKILVKSGKRDIPNLTYNTVDLGLPSGILWADRNVGATSVEDSGSYFQWGDTKGYIDDGVGTLTLDLKGTLNLLSKVFNTDLTGLTKSEFDYILKTEYNVVNGDLTTLGVIYEGEKPRDWDIEDYNQELYFKYNDQGGLTTLASEDDAATQNMGSGWRMPTREDLQELIDNTTHMFVDFDGNEYTRSQLQEYNQTHGYPMSINYIKFTSLNNSNILYITHEIWSASCQDVEYAWFLQALDAETWNIIPNTYAKHYGYSVRGVKD